MIYIYFDIIKSNSKKEKVIYHYFHLIYMFRNKKRSGALIQNRKKPKRNIEQSSEISLWLENYNELFSGFDPRPYSHRALSSDFLSETKKASIDKDEKIDLELLIPSNKRDKTKEDIIRKRLRDHFNRHLNLLKTEINHMVWKGFSLAITGVVLMFIATLILFNYGDNTLFLSFLIILLEPAGWFLFWEGLDIILFESKKIKPDLEYYKKMAKCNINFVSY